MRPQVAIKMLLIAIAVFTPISLAHADNLNIIYYTISSSDPDANHLSCCNVIPNEVQAGLGPNGLPLLNTALYGPGSPNPFVYVPGYPNPNGGPNPTSFNVNVVSTANPEITYWDPALNPYVTQTGSGVVSLPVNFGSNFFPPNGTGSADGGDNGFQAAYLSGTLNAGTTETLTFNVGSDDMAFVYLDGQNVCDDGGVHGSAGVPCTTPTILAGSHNLQIFFVDMNTVQSGLTFSVQTEGVSVSSDTSVPEPSSILLFASGFLALAVIRRKQLRLNESISKT
jgi:hypothetical protein